MGLKKLAAKVAAYKERVEAGTASKIEPKHVEKVLAKLRKNETKLARKLEAARTAEDREQSARKLEVAREQIARAQWLLDMVN
jgi:hypothetical protein